MTIKMEKVQREQTNEDEEKENRNHKRQEERGK